MFELGFESCYAKKQLSLNGKEILIEKAVEPTDVYWVNMKYGSNDK